MKEWATPGNIFLSLFLTVFIGGLLYMAIKQQNEREADPDYGKQFTLIWEITNLRVDDDSEYHFTAVTPGGRIHSWDDVSLGLSFTMRVNDAIHTPRIVTQCEYVGTHDGSYVELNEPKPMIEIPTGYTFETFDD